MVKETKIDAGKEELFKGIEQCLATGVVCVTIQNIDPDTLRLLRNALLFYAELGEHWGKTTISEELVEEIRGLRTDIGVIAKQIKEEKEQLSMQVPQWGIGTATPYQPIPITTTTTGTTTKLNHLDP